jgi:hypothetical protein
MGLSLMLPEPETAKNNRRGCYLVVALVALALALFGLLASRTADTARSNEAISEVGPVLNR